MEGGCEDAGVAYPSLRQGDGQGKETVELENYALGVDRYWGATLNPGEGVDLLFWRKCNFCFRVLSET